jgi:hypothetical protein
LVLLIIQYYLGIKAAGGTAQHPDEEGVKNAIYNFYTC